MFNKSVDNTRHVNGPAHTLVSRSTEIVGDIHFSGELIIEGKVKGNIYAEDDSEALIRVTENGSVEGEICVPSAIVNGLVQGDVRAAIHIELAEVNGNLMHIGSNQPRTNRLTANHKKLPFNSKSLQE